MKVWLEETTDMEGLILTPGLEIATEEREEGVSTKERVK